MNELIQVAIVLYKMYTFH